jgi:LemA protein
MKIGAVIALIVVAVLALGGVGACNYAVSTNNRMVILQEEAYNKLGYVSSALQRRADLLPNVAKVVSRYATHEQKTFVETAAARASAAGSVKLTPELLNDPEALAKFNAAQGDISSFFSRLMVIQEQYPELKADRLFIDLQAQVEGSENRIKVERDNYNEAATAYNKAIGVFPASVVAGFRDFKRMPPFEADAAAKKAPDLGDSLQ